MNTVEVDMDVQPADDAGDLRFYMNSGKALEEKARLYIKDGRLHFEGEMPPTEAAQMFIDEVNRLLASRP